MKKQIPALVISALLILALVSLLVVIRSNRHLRSECIVHEQAALAIEHSFDRQADSLQKLLLSSEIRRDSLAAVVHTTRLAVDMIEKQSRLIMLRSAQPPGAPGASDSAISQEPQLRATIDDLEVQLVRCKDMVREVDSLRVLLARLQKRNRQLEALHTIRALFVAENALLNGGWGGDAGVDEKKAKEAILAMFDSCASSLGWSERFCAVNKIIFGVDAVEQYREIKNASSKLKLTYESLYFLTKSSGFDPATIDRSALRELTRLAVINFPGEKAGAWDVARVLLQQNPPEDFCRRMREQVENPKNW